ncbi:MAG: orotidine-5'-phosphate decarboxylase [Eubacteriales bacterium]
MITDKLIDKIIETNAPICVGLDTHLGVMPASYIKNVDVSDLSKCADKIFEYNKILIDKLADIIPSVKLQNAYYEMYGIAGIEAYAKTIEYAHSANMIVIADVKRGDIGSTCTAYADAHLGKALFNADFMTVNPYFGTDGMQPFLDKCIEDDKGLFVLVKTSNPSSSELQDLMTDDGSKIYEKCADLVIKWGNTAGKHGYNSIGAVVGATHKEEGISLRKKMKNTFFLIPGYGAQGAAADDIAGMFDKNGVGGIVNSSRGIIGAWKKAETDDFAQSAYDATVSMIESIDKALNNK